MKISRFLSFLFAILSVSAFSCSALTDDDIFCVEPIKPAFLSVFSLPDMYWSYDEPEFLALPLFNLTGKGVRIGIVDSGLTPHPNIPQENIVASKNFVDETREPLDGFGHGTPATDLIIGSGKEGMGAKGIAPDAEIVIAKCFSDDGTIKNDHFLSAVKFCIENDCDVINISAGTRFEIPDYTTNSFLVSLKSLIDFATENNIIVVASAGNSGETSGSSDFVSYPAGFSNVIGVGAVATGFVHTPTSQENESVWITAPGSNVFMAKSGTDYGTYISGTSFSAPIITGLVALIKQVNMNATLAQVKEILKTSAQDCGDLGYDISFGHGVANGRNLAKILRNSDFYAYKDDSGVRFASNIGGQKNIVCYSADYDGARLLNTRILPLFFSDMERKELTVSGDRLFFWQEDLSPLCNAIN